jgi:triosephosphate isomerase
MRKKLVVGNWKLNLSQAQSVSLVEGVVQRTAVQDSVEVAVCPTFLSISKVREVTKKSRVEVGAQDAFWVDSGAFTGQVSASLLADAGVKYVIVGHSETRGRFGKLDIPEDTVGYFAESNRTINLKIKALLYHSLWPILCVGETLSEREAGETDLVIGRQLREALDQVDGSEFFSGVVAYEPVWAIGTGKVCDGEEASRVCGVIRDTLREVCGDAADSIRVLYGGSVKSTNAQDLFRRPDIDGGLVGGASLDPDEFARIVLCAV